MAKAKNGSDAKNGTHAKNGSANGVQAEAGPVPSGSQADYDAWLPAAQKIAAADVMVMRADPQLALHNVTVGVGNVLAEEGRLAKLPETNAKELASLRQVALAVIFASTQLARPGANSALPGKVSRGAVLRAFLLQTAEALALGGLLPQAEVDKIRAGYGRLDAARDLVALAAIFGKHAAKLKGKHSISAAQLKEAADLGTELLTLLKPGRAKTTTAGTTIGAAERDRLWTLLVQGHDRLWRAGAYLFGHAVAAKVPALQASSGGRPKKAAAPATTTAGATT